MIAPIIRESRKKPSRLANFFASPVKQPGEEKLKKWPSRSSQLALAVVAASATGNLPGYQKIHRRTRAYLTVKILIFITKGLIDWVQDTVTSPKFLKTMANHTLRLKELLTEVAMLCIQAVIVVFEEGLKMLAYVTGQQLDKPKSVRGQNILVTGSAGALGQRVAARLALTHGARIILWDINEESAEQVARAIRERGGIAFAYQCDVSDEKQVEETAKRVLLEVGEVDILVNNAAILHCRPLLQLSSKDIKRTFEVNLLAHYLTTKQFLPRMLARGKGHIVALASVAGLIGTANMTDYCGSKFGVVGFMESLEEELESTPGGDAVQLTTICPVAFKSGLVHRMESRFPAVFPIMEADEIADEAVLAILNDEEHVVIPRRVGFISRLSHLLPRRVTKMGQRFCSYASDAISNKDAITNTTTNNNNIKNNSINVPNRRQSHSALKFKNSFTSFMTTKMTGSKKVKDYD